MCGKGNVWKKGIKALLLGAVALCTRIGPSTCAGPMLWINCPIFQPCSVPCLVPNIPFFPTHPHMWTFNWQRWHQHAGFFFSWAQFLNNKNNQTRLEYLECGVYPSYPFDFKLSCQFQLLYVVCMNIRKKFLWNTDQCRGNVCQLLSILHVAIWCLTLRPWATEDGGGGGGYEWGMRPDRPSGERPRWEKWHLGGGGAGGAAGRPGVLVQRKTSAETELSMCVQYLFQQQITVHVRTYIRPRW
jgi:hypothetical protein